MAVSGALLSAQVTIDNWSMTDSTLSFEINGSTTTGFTPTMNTSRIFIAIPGVNTWINTSNSGSATGTIDGKTSFLTFAQDYSNGDYIEILTSSGEYDFTDGGMFSISATFTGQDFTAANLAENSLKVFWGTNSNGAPFPSAATQIGSFSAVPEPGSFAVWGGVFALITVAFRRQRRRPTV